VNRQILKWGNRTKGDTERERSKGKEGHGRDFGGGPRKELLYQEGRTRRLPGKGIFRKRLEITGEPWGGKLKGRSTGCRPREHRQEKKKKLFRKTRGSLEADTLKRRLEEVPQPGEFAGESHQKITEITKWEEAFRREKKDEECKSRKGTPGKAVCGEKGQKKKKFGKDVDVGPSKGESLGQWKRIPRKGKIVLETAGRQRESKKTALDCGKRTPGSEEGGGGFDAGLEKKEATERSSLKKRMIRSQEQGFDQGNRLMVLDFSLAALAFSGRGVGGGGCGGS